MKVAATSIRSGLPEFVVSKLKRGFFKEVKIG